MNIAVAQSGGPTCAINASLLGVFRTGIQYTEIDTVYGSLNGIEGLIYNNLVDLNTVIASDEELELIRQTPSTVLGSCRYKLPQPEDDKAVYETITKNLKDHNIKAFFYIGGNDSMDTVVKLSRYFKNEGEDIKVIGIPKTIDNDLPHTDHTPGFGSAAKYVATTLQEITRDSSVYSAKSVTIVEIMGRDTGWLTASSVLLRANSNSAPHLIYLPEKPFSVSKFLDDVVKMQEKYPSVIVAVSEGVSLSSDEAGEDFTSGKEDIFGHKYLAGVGKALEKIVSREIGCKVRSIELNVMQRCSSHLSSGNDIAEAENIGAAAVKEMMSGKTGVMMTFERLGNKPYNLRIGCVEAEKVANHVKYFPDEWIAENNCDVTHRALEYFLPLIQGEPSIRIKNGLPAHFVLSKEN